MSLIYIVRYTVHDVAPFRLQHHASGFLGIARMHEKVDVRHGTRAHVSVDAVRQRSAFEQHDSRLRLRECGKRITEAGLEVKRREIGDERDAARISSRTSLGTRWGTLERSRGYTTDVARSFCVRRRKRCQSTTSVAAARSASSSTASFAVNMRSHASGDPPGGRVRRTAADGASSNRPESVTRVRRPARRSSRRTDPRSLGCRRSRGRRARPRRAR